MPDEQSIRDDVASSMVPDRSTAGLRGRLAYVEAKLDYEIDVIAAARAVSQETAVFVDTRRRRSWEHGHIVGALHLASEPQFSSLPSDRTLIVYGWGPGCNGATVAAHRLLTAGFDVREMIGGYEYWVRNGFTVVRQGEQWRGSPDPLVTAEL